MEIKGIETGSIHLLPDNRYIIHWSEAGDKAYSDLVEVLFDLKRGIVSFTKYDAIGNVITKYSGGVSLKFSSYE